jgi:hypothetical protein
MKLGEPRPWLLPLPEFFMGRVPIRFAKLQMLLKKISSIVCRRSSFGSATPFAASSSMQRVTALRNGPAWPVQLCL